MALTVIKRPQGHVLSTTENTATVSSSSGALFTKSTHGLSTGDYIYIYSALSAYNGYWYVQINDANSFRIFEYPTATQQAYVNSGTVTYYKSTYTHGWSCVHLPIVYKLKSDAWPTNGLDTARTITTFSNYSGYTYIVASGDIKATGTASALEEVVLSGTSVDGVYKILNWFSDTNFVIDLAYSGSNVLSGGTVQYYYFNYHARIKIYAGIASGHTWQAQKAYEEIAELKAVPDSSGVITININEILKNKIEILKNDPVKDTLPNNIDAWCNFYITYAESYDDSNMYTVSEYVSSYTDDSATFQGYAVNSKLPFKTRSSGYLSEYLGASRKFLTAFTEPVLFVGQYYDIGFLNDFGSAEIKRENYTDGTIDTTTYEAVTDYDSGVYRVPVVQHGSEDRIDLTLVVNTTLGALNTFTNSGSGTIWTTGSNPSVALAPTTSSRLLRAAFTSIPGHSYSFTYNIDCTDVLGVAIVTFAFKTAASVTVGSNTIVMDAAEKSGTITVPCTAPGGEYFSVSIYNDASAGTNTIDIDTLSYSGGYLAISETKTVNINDDCANQDYYLTWLNIYGGFDYWNFTARKVYSVDVTGNIISDKNINTEWPKSYGEFADTIKEQTQRTSNEVIRVSSQFLTTDQEDAIKQIFSSPLVQLCTSKYDRRAVIVDPSTYRIRKDQDDLRTISFDLRYTDDIPSQSL